MRVLFQSRTTIHTVPGGDTIQILKTKEYLEKLGVEVDISTGLEPDLSGYDIVHLFNLIRPQEVLIQSRNARKQGKKIVLSTIFVDYSEYERKARQGAGKWLNRILTPSQIEYLKTLARAVLNKEYNHGTLEYLRQGHLKSQIELISLVDIFLPNSKSEMERVIKSFPQAESKPFVVVPNAVDHMIFSNKNENKTDQLADYENCVLCVARIEGHKNQLNLVRAMNGLPISLLLIGKPAPNHMKYYNCIKKEAGPNIHILGDVPHKDLPKYYNIGKVHCLVSWMETTGLSSLEAGIMNCNLVITDKGDTRDYFKDYVYYCQPDSVESIRQAVISAYEQPVNKHLRDHILENYTWDKTAEKTLEGYGQVVESNDIKIV